MKSKTMSYFLFIFTAVASFLFFTIQLTSSKIITPVFGGIAWVWILTMLFYQGVLLVGYYLAGILKNKLTKNILFILGILLAVSSFVIPAPNEWGTSLHKFGMSQVLYVLAVSIGLPGIVLSASTVILQKAAYSAEISPWQLYFYSNIGSLSAIFLYPFVIENLFSITIFMNMWKLMLFILGLTIAVLGLFVNKKFIFSKEDKFSIIVEKPKKTDIFIWLLFSALPSSFLAMSTAFLTEDIASMPFLWAMPLGVFMFAFSLPFAPKSISTYKYGIHYIINTVIILGLIYIFLLPGKEIIRSIAVCLIAVFYVTWTNVSALVKNKPAPEYLQYFYVSLAVGGFIGNFFISVISPVIFDTYVERWVIVALILIIPALLMLLNNSKYWMFKRNNMFKISVGLSLIIIISFIGIAYGNKEEYLIIEGKKIASERSMYGPLKVEDDFFDFQTVRLLYNGNTEHGFQKIKDGVLIAKEPTAYYNYDTALDYFYSFFSNLSKENEDKKVAVVGLGIGTMNFYTYPGIETTFYEINKDVEKIARTYFTYLDIENTNFKVKIGDGRLMIGKQPDKTYSLILVDAFTGVSIPRHLLTTEAIKVYAQKLNDDGVMMIHASNRYLFVEKIVNLSVYNNGLYCYIDDNPDSVWVVASKKPLSNFEEIGIEEYKEVEELKDKTWTDDYTPLIPFMYKR